MRLLRSGGRRGALTAAATACASAGAGLLALALQHELVTPPPPPPAAQAAPHGTGLSQPPTDDTVLPRSAPLRITAPGIGLSTAIDTVGLAEDGSVALPQDADHAGWFTGSVTPGERGNAIIVGHLDSTTGPAAFYGLGNLRTGDRVNVQRRDGREATFALIRAAVYDKNRFPSDLVYGPTPGAQLTLITCAGWDRDAGEYRANLVITARLTDDDAKQ